MKVKELIIRLLDEPMDADVLIKDLDDAIQDAKSKGEICDYWEDDRSNLLHYLDSAPTVDAVEVVRCKDCKHKPRSSDHYDYNDIDCGFEIIFPDDCCPCRCEDEYYNRIPNDDWYCGNGERKE